MKFPRISALIAALTIAATTAFGAVTVVTDARPGYGLTLMTSGQSLIDQITYTNGAQGLVSELIAKAVSPTVSSVEIVRRAVGGSYGCHENDPFAGSGNSWVLYNGGSPIASDLLTAAVNDIAARVTASAVPGAPNNVPNALIHDHGQADAIALAGNVAGVTAGDAATMYDACWKFAFAQMRAAAGSSIPIFIEILGRSCQDDNGSGWDALRKIQLAWLAGGVANMYRVPDTYDMATYACVHPDRSYVEAYGRRFAAKIANVMFSGTAKLGPTISGMTQPTANTVQVTLAVEAGDSITRPVGEPWGFDFYDGTTLLGKTWVGWFSGNPRWTLSAVPGLLQMAYLSRAGAAPLLDDPARIIKGTSSGIPLAQRYLP